MKIGMLRKSLFVIAIAVLLPGCGNPEEDSVSGGLTADEVSQLNDAAEMLDVSGAPPPPANSAQR